MSGGIGRNRAYVFLMGAALALVVLAWTVIRLYSLPAAIGMSVAGMAIPPVAAIVANAGDEYSRGWLGRAGGRREAHHD